MTKWLLMIVGSLALAVIGFAALDWSMVSRMIDRQTQQGQVELQRAHVDGMKAELRSGCTRQFARRLDAQIREEEIRDACECAAETIYEEFEDELPDILKSRSADRATDERAVEIMQECADQAGL